MVMISLLNSGPFHGWFALKFNEDGMLYTLLRVSIGIDAFLWNLVFVLTIFIVMNLLILSTIRGRNKTSSYVAYSHQLV